MTTTQRHRHRRAKRQQATTTTVVVDTRDASAQATEFVYAVTAALGVNTIAFAEQADIPVAASIKISGNVISAAHVQWHYPQHETSFEQWLVTTCFQQVENSIVWAVVQTGDEVFPLLSAAMAYAHARDGALLVDAGAQGSLTETIREATYHHIDALKYDHYEPSAHITLVNTPTWHDVSLMLHTTQTNALQSAALNDIVRAARYHFLHTVIDCGADLFLGQRLAHHGARVIHIDDQSHPLYVDLQPYKTLNCHSHKIPAYGTGRDFQDISNTTRRRGRMRRWMKHGDVT